jgi:hypothetical protein
MKQLENIEQKDIIKSVTGKVTKLWEPKTFNGDKGEFTIQGGEIVIDGDTYGLKFFNQKHDSDKLKGQTVTLTSTRGKHGLNGVTLDHESFSTKNGEKVDRDVIKVTATGKVEIGSGGEVQQSESPKPKAIVTDTDPRLALADIVVMHLYIDGLVRHTYSSRKYDEETLRAYVSSIYIEANRKGLVFQTGTAKQEEPVYSAEDWASAIVPKGHPKFKELGGKKLGEIGKPALTKLYQYFLESPSDKPFAKCVEQAANDLQLDAPIEEVQDDIPW